MHLGPAQYNQYFLNTGAEATSVLVGNLEELDEQVVVFVRLSQVQAFFSFSFSP